MLDQPPARDPSAAWQLRIPAERARSNTASVAQTLGTSIIGGLYRAGTRLPADAELLVLFGVSRPVLRESVKTLAAKGLVTTKARVGTVVRHRSAWNMFDADVLAWHLDVGIDQEFLRDLAEIRLAVEPQAASLAAWRRGAADMLALREGLATMHRESSDAAGFANGDLALHLAVANASGNPFMRSLGAVIEAALRASFLLSAPVEAGQREKVLSAHRSIVDAIEAGDPMTAAAAMVDVIQGGLERHGAIAGRRSLVNNTRRAT